MYFTDEKTIKIYFNIRIINIVNKNQRLNSEIN